MSARRIPRTIPLFFVIDKTTWGENQLALFLDTTVGNGYSRLGLSHTFRSTGSTANHTEARQVSCSKSEEHTPRYTMTRDPTLSNCSGLLATTGRNSSEGSNSLHTAGRSSRTRTSRPTIRSSGRGGTSSGASWAFHRPRYSVKPDSGRTRIDPGRLLRTTGYRTRKDSTRSSNVSRASYWRIGKQST